MTLWRRLSEADVCITHFTDITDDMVDDVLSTIPPTVVYL